MAAASVKRSVNRVLFIKRFSHVASHGTYKLRHTNVKDFSRIFKDLDLFNKSAFFNPL